MSKKKRTRNSRDAPVSMQKQSFLVTEKAWEVLCGDGYKPLSQCPEVQMCIGVYADLIASMTIQLMENTDGGDVRVKNALSRKIDIEPHRLMTHQTWVSNLVRVMLTEGNQVTVPTYTGDLLDDLEPMPPSAVSFVPDGTSYRIMVQGVPMKPEEVLHFPVNPDPEKPYMGLGYTVTLGDVVKSLRQTNATKNALMASPAPSIIVKVDGYTEELKTPEGRRELAQQYADTQGSNIPWFVPADLFEVTTVKPLTLNDLAIKTSMELDKRAVAAIFGVPPFLVGVGAFNAGEFDWFVANKVMPIARIIEQELTRKLLISPRMYFRFNNRSLLNYNLQTVVSAGSAMVDRAAMRRNELRDWMGLPPDALMDDILILENYIRKNKLTKDLNGPDDSQTGGESDETGQTDQDTGQ